MKRPFVVLVLAAAAAGACAQSYEQRAATEKAVSALEQLDKAAMERARAAQPAAAPLQSREYGPREYALAALVTIVGGAYLWHRRRRPARRPDNVSG